VLTAQPKRVPSSAFTVILIAIALAAAIPRLMLGASQYIEYDGYWHVFIAQQDTWPRFWEDVYANAHPPLYFLLLKAVLVFGRSLLVYRSISLLSGIASVFMLGWIARKVTGSQARAYQAALAYGFAMPAIIMACEVRSYMLSTLFVLLSFSSLLDVARAEGGRAEMRARVWFTVWTILACLSEYFAFFYAGAAILVLSGSFVFGMLRKRETGLPRPAWWVELLTILPILATIGTLYFGHAGNLATIQGHLIPYYFDPHGKESVLAFVLRNSRNFLNLFLPFEIVKPAAAVAFGIAAMLAGVLVGALAGATDVVMRSARWTLLVSAFALGAIMAAGIAGKYPFGGDLRQQFLLFPFLVLCLAIVVERVAVALQGYFPAAGKFALNLALAAVAAGVGIAQYVHYPKISVNVLAPQMAAFDRMEQAPAAVYLDQFNLITFFIYHHDWKWTAEREQPIDGIDIYRLQKDGRQMLVFRDKTRWNSDPDETPLYGAFARSLKLGKTPALSVFGVRQAPPKLPFASVRGVQSEILGEAADSAVCVQKMAVTPTTWYVTFRKSGCPPFELPYEGGAPDAAPKIEASVPADDLNEAIQYVGDWKHGNFEGSREGTLSYSNDPGAVARVSFEGSEITYGYTKAFNRGLAEIRIDGASKGKVDLYSGATVFQQKSTYSHLGQGRHTLEIVVTGEKSPQSADRYVDVDWLLAK
jgi:hypothetical protein